jgi:hypothetical protein
LDQTGRPDATLDLIRFLSEAEDIRKQIIEQNQDLFEELGIYEGPTIGEAHRRVKERLHTVYDQRDKGYREQARQLNRIMASLGMKFWLYQVDTTMMETPDSSIQSEDMKRLYSMYMAGIYRGILLMIDEIDKDGSFNFFKDIFHSMKCTEAVDSRWVYDREDYEQAKAEADSYWRGGGKDLHHIVAKRLAKKYNVSAASLRKLLIPIAKSYNKVFGFKGVRKEM